jgi:hypothetical protein
MSINADKSGQKKPRAPKGLYPSDDLDFGDLPLPEDDEPQPKKTAARVEMRASMREESDAERARLRAAEIRGHLGDMDEGTDEFYIPPDIIPDGWTYEWKRYSTYNQIDSSHIRELERKGWSFVPSNRPKHASLMAIGDSGNIILRKGLVLMERPTEIVEEARMVERRRASDQVRSKEQQLAGTPEGTMTRDHAKARPQIKKSYEAIPIPEK